MRCVICNRSDPDLEISTPPACNVFHHVCSDCAIDDDCAACLAARYNERDDEDDEQEDREDHDDHDYPNPDEEPEEEDGEDEGEPAFLDEEEQDAGVDEQEEEFEDPQQSSSRRANATTHYQPRFFRRDGDDDDQDYGYYGPSQYGNDMMCRDNSFDQGRGGGGGFSAVR